MLIGLMSLPNGIVFVQFHPVAYVSQSLYLVNPELVSSLFEFFVLNDANARTDGQAQHRDEHGRHDYQGCTKQ